MPDYRREYNKLNSAEKLALALRPIAVGTVRDDAEKALSEASARFSAASLHNGPGDAFRHCYWSALLTRDIGFQNAKAITDAHEEFPHNPANEKEMDLHNNMQGMFIGIGHKRSTDREIADLCEAALRAGRLKVLNP
jgi:hypothetical protein